MNKKQQPKKVLLVNACGALGYIACLMLWGWTGIIYVPMILENEKIEQLLLPSQGEEVVAPIATTTEVSPIAVFLALAITAIVMIATIVVLLRAPMTIARTGKSVTTKAATSALPLIARGKPLPAAKKKRLTANLVKLAKLLLVLAPVAALSLGVFVELPLPFEIVALVSGVLALIAVSWFSAQYLLARWLGVNLDQLV